MRIDLKRGFYAFMAQARQRRKRFNKKSYQARALIDNDRLSPAMQLLLVHKYINGYTFKRISEKTDYNVDHLRRLHGRALAILAGID